MLFVPLFQNFGFSFSLYSDLMQCSELVIRQKPNNMTIMAQNMGLIETSASARLLSKKPPEKEIIHSGHFMVSNFEADAQDDEDVFASNSDEGKRDETSSSGVSNISPSSGINPGSAVQKIKPAQHISIETSLTKLFQCMSLAYRQKLTSPKWNRFKGIRLRWKDKIRLNNVIWRCWHMQFITKKNSLVCQFASPLDTDTHNKPEAIVLEGKYWKRKLNAVTAEYKKWRLFYRNRLLGCCPKDGQDPQDMLSELELLAWQPHGDDSHMMVDEDYMEFMTDTLFSTITANQPFAFPDTREIARGASLADFIQPSLVQLQPNLDDFMDTFEPLQELFYSKLPPVPEESNTSVSTDNLYRSLDYQATTADTKQPEMSSSYQAPSPPAVPPPPPPSQYYQYSPQQSQHPPSPKSRPPAYHGAIYSMPQYQQLSPPPAQRTSPSPPNPSQGGEFISPPPHTAPNYPRVPIRSNSLPMAGSLPSRRDEEMFAVPKLKMFNRSRSGSCLAGNMKPPPPLVSAVSEPQLAVGPPPHSTSALLAHLLTSTSTTSHAFTSPAASGFNNETLKMSESLPSLQDTYYKKPEQLEKPSQHRSVIYSTQSDNGSLNLSARGSSVADSRIPQIYETFTFTGGPQRHRKTSAPHLLHHPPPPPALMLSQVSPSSAPAQVISSASNSPKHPDSPAPSDCLSLSPLNVGSPGSTTPHSPTTGVYKEHRRVSHINAEQKRRCNIKNGFDTLHSLIPQLSQNPNAKLSKAAMLQKGAEYIRQLRGDRQTLKDEIDSLRQQVESLNSAISNCQAMLPATGAPVSRHRSTKMREMYDEYVRVRTQENWKFWILSLLCEPLLNSFNSQVSTQSLDELYRTTLNWVDQHCTLSVLRPLVLNALRQLCTTTDILSDPGRLPAEARAAVSKASSRPHPPS